MNNQLWCFPPIFNVVDKSVWINRVEWVSVQNSFKTMMIMGRLSAIFHPSVFHVEKQKVFLLFSIRYPQLFHHYVDNFIFLGFLHALEMLRL